jgi:hypothetical protein
MAADEEQRLRSVALLNAQSILLARRRAEEELLRAREALRQSQERLTRPSRRPEPAPSAGTSTRTSSSGTATSTDCWALAAITPSKNPDERFQSARDLAFALRHLTGSSAIAEPVAAAARPAQRQPGWMPLAGFAIGVVLAGALALRWAALGDVGSIRCS